MGQEGRKSDKGRTDGSLVYLYSGFMAGPADVVVSNCWLCYENVQCFRQPCCKFVANVFCYPAVYGTCSVNNKSYNNCRFFTSGRLQCRLHVFCTSQQPCEVFSLIVSLIKTTSAGLLHLSPVNSHCEGHFRHLLGYDQVFLDVEALRSSETSVAVYRTTRLTIPDTFSFFLQPYFCSQRLSLS